MKCTYIGVLRKEIAEYWNIPEHSNKPILMYEDRRQHVIDNHSKDFENIEQIDRVIADLSRIIKNPDYTFYNQETSGLEYYKMLDTNICVAVRISFGKTLKIRSFYPANNNKINNRKRKAEEIGKIEELV